MPNCPTCGQHTSRLDHRDGVAQPEGRETERSSPYLPTKVHWWVWVLAVGIPAIVCFLLFMGEEVLGLIQEFLGLA